AGTRFIDLPRAAGFSVLEVQDVVRFDTARRRTRFEQPCAACGRHLVVAGATPAFLRIDGALPDRLFPADVECGTGNEQHPLVIAGPGLADRLAAARLEGLDLGPVAASAGDG